jgi:hypothetical protein
VEKLVISGELDGYRLLAPIRGHDTSGLAALALAWEGRRGLRLGLDGELWSNPYFTEQARAVLSVTATDELFSRRPLLPPARPLPAPEAKKRKEEPAEDKGETPAEDKGEAPAEDEGKPGSMAPPTEPAPGPAEAAPAGEGA